MRPSHHLPIRPASEHKRSPKTDLRENRRFGAPMEPEESLFVDIPSPDAPEACFAYQPLLGVQLHIGGQVLPTLVDTAASESFIDAALERRLALSCLPLAQPTPVRAANGQHMDCATNVCSGFSFSPELSYHFVGG